MTAVLLLMGLVLGTLYSWMFSSQNTVLDTSERLRNLDEARTLMATMTKDIRTAVRTEAGTSPFLVADKENSSFYANLDTTARRSSSASYIDSPGPSLRSRSGRTTRRRSCRSISTADRPTEYCRPRA